MRFAVGFANVCSSSEFRGNAVVGVGVGMVTFEKAEVDEGLSILLVVFAI